MDNRRQPVRSPHGQSIDVSCQRSTKKAVGEAEKSPTATMRFLVTVQEALRLKKGIIILWAVARRCAMPTAAGAKTAFAHEFRHETAHASR
jgi:hypothetical protein